jgi:hypothetical protein
LYALRGIGDGFLVRPSGCFDAPAQFGQFRFRNIHLKWPNGMLVSRRFAAWLRGERGCYAPAEVSVSSHAWGGFNSIFRLHNWNSIGLNFFVFEFGVSLSQCENSERSG